MALKYKTKSKQQKATLVDVPMDELGQIANDYVGILREIGSREKTLEDMTSSLIEVMKRSRRFSITADGVTLKLKEIESKSKIVVNRPKEN